MRRQWRILINIPGRVQTKEPPRCVDVHTTALIISPSIAEGGDIMFQSANTCFLDLWCCKARIGVVRHGFCNTNVNTRIISFLGFRKSDRGSRVAQNTG